MSLISALKQALAREKENEHSSSANAKRRLSILLVEDRTDRQFEFMPQLRQDIVNVLRKYMLISNEDVQVTCNNLENNRILEMSVNLDSCMPRQDSGSDGKTGD